MGRCVTPQERVFECVRYTAISKYPEASNEFHVFTMNEKYGGISDYLFNSIEECK